MARMPATSVVALISFLNIVPLSAVAADDVVVTANRIPMPAASLGSAVTVIDGEDLQRRQVREVQEILRQVPGVAVSQAGGSGRGTAVRMRGMEGHHTLLLIDGVEVSDPSQAQQSYDFGHLMVSDIERIEIVRGPQSTLHGADAIGGVINIITRRGSGEPTVTGMAETGSFSTYRARTGVSGATERVHYAAEVGYDKTDGFSAADERNGNPEADGYENRRFSGSIGVAITDWLSVDATARAMDAEVETDSWAGGRAVDSDDAMDQRERSGRIAATLDTLGGTLQHRVSASLSSTKRDLFAGGVQTSFFDGARDKLDYQGTWSVTEAVTLIAGIEQEREEAETSGGIDTSVTSRAGYADVQAALLDGSLFLTLGGRLDDHEAAGRHDTYRTTAAYFIDATATRLHASWGTGFRAPSLFELYAGFWGNPSLRPETSRGWDVGVEQTLWDDRVVADVTVFRNDAKNLIQWQPTGYTNIASTRAFGVEGSLRVAVTDDLSTQATYTYTESRNGQTGQILPRRPKHSGSLHVDWAPMEGLSTGLGMDAVAHTYDSATGRLLGGYAVFGLTAAYDVLDGAEVFGRVENLFDQQYQDVDTYGTAGRSAYVGVRLRY